MVCVENFDYYFPQIENVDLKLKEKMKFKNYYER